MEKETITKAVEQLKKQKQRNFSQSYDLIINLKHLDTKTHPLDFSITLPYPIKKPKIAIFLQKELQEQASKFCDLIIKDTDFPNYPPKQQKKLAKTYDYFIAQANLMPKVAQVFGKTLAPLGKMPNPKLGCVIPPNANLEPLIKKLQSSIKLTAKNALNLQCLVGKQSQPEEQIINNILTIYNQTLKQLPQGKQNLKNIKLKLTMSKPVKLEL